MYYNLCCAYLGTILYIISKSVFEIIKRFVAPYVNGGYVDLNVGCAKETEKDIV